MDTRTSAERKGSYLSDLPIWLSPHNNIAPAFGWAHLGPVNISTIERNLPKPNGGRNNQI
jgi:hypothetical protein